MFSSRLSVIQLYRSILKEHRRHLDPELRHLADEYLKSEWRLHQKATDVFRQKFLLQWSRYLETIRQQTRASALASQRQGVVTGAERKGLGVDLQADVLNKLTMAQRKQLALLKEETTKAMKSS